MCFARTAQTPLIQLANFFALLPENRLQFRQLQRLLVASLRRGQQLGQLQLQLPIVDGDSLLEKNTFDVCIAERHQSPNPGADADQKQNRIEGNQGKY